MHPDNWLSAILGVCAFNGQLDPEGETLVDVASKLSEARCFASIKLSCDDIASSIQLQDMGFRQVDTALTFRSDMRLDGECSRISFACDDDADSVEQIAGKSFSNSRFHLDPNVDNHAADQIKAKWAANFFAGKRGDAMIVARNSAKKIVGFCQVLKPDAETAVIDLIAVSPDETGSGLGQEMLVFLWKNAIAGDRVENILVGTQAANLGAVKFYENAGFRLIKSQNILHFSN